MINSVLSVYVGRIYRSPLGAATLSKDCPGLKAGATGLSAVAGAPADPMTSEAALEIGINLSSHVASQLTRHIATAFDSVLVMQKAIRRIYPEVTGRAMRLGQWVESPEIADPYRLPLAKHRRILDEGES
jgi:protein-tyrosine phosphatase